MTPRANYQRIAPESLKALMSLEKTLAETSLGHAIVDLVKIRASQLNGCLFCLDLHSKEAKLHGERELRLYHLALWRESSLFTEAEKAAIEWAELLTLPGKHGAEDADYRKLELHFTEKEIVELTLIVSAINAWNRLGIAFRSTPGTLDRLMGLDKAGLN
jgi:AhpD family alkylhydroperoxidase